MMELIGLMMLMSKDIIELEASCFAAVKLYYDRDEEALKKRLVYMATIPRYHSTAMRWRWWTRFLVDAKAFLGE